MVFVRCGTKWKATQFADVGVGLGLSAGIVEGMNFGLSR